MRVDGPPFHKFERAFHRFVKLYRFAHRCGGVVSVASQVNFSAFHHHEKPAVAVETPDPVIHKIGQRRAASLVDDPRHVSVRRFGMHRDYLVRRRLLPEIADYRVSLRRRCAVKVGAFFVAPFGISETAPAEILMSAVGQLNAEGIMFGPLFRVSVERGRSGVLKERRRDHARFHSLAACCFGNRDEFFAGFGIHPHRSVLRFMPRRERCAGRGRVSDARERIGYDESLRRQRIHHELRLAGRYVPKRVPHARQIHFGGVPLRRSHSVSDEKKYIFGGALRAPGEQDRRKREQEKAPHDFFRRNSAHKTNLSARIETWIPKS
jgi:hypothetical protein